MAFPIGNTILEVCRSSPRPGISDPSSARGEKPSAIPRLLSRRLCDTGTRFISDLENGKETIELGKSLRVAQALGIDLVVHIRGEEP